MMRYSYDDMSQHVLNNVILLDTEGQLLDLRGLVVENPLLLRHLPQVLHLEGGLVDAAADLAGPWLRTNGVNPNGAAAKVTNLVRLGKKVRLGTFGHIKVG